MRLTAATFTGVVLSVLGIGLSAGTDVISHHQAVNEGVVILSRMVLAGVALNQAAPGLLMAAADRFRRIPLIGGSNSFFPLHDAARELYEANLDTPLGAAARLDAGGGAEPLEWCCYWIAPRFPEIYGRRPPLTVLERVPAHLFTYAHFEDGGRRLAGGDEGDFVDLAVHRRAFRRMIPALSNLAGWFDPSSTTAP